MPQMCLLVNPGFPDLMKTFTSEALLCLTLRIFSMSSLPSGFLALPAFAAYVPTVCFQFLAQGTESLKCSFFHYALKLSCLFSLVLLVGDFFRIDFYV